MNLPKPIQDGLLGLGFTAVVGLGGLTIANASDVQVLNRDIAYITKQLDRIEAKLDAALGAPNAHSDSGDRSE